MAHVFCVKWSNGRLAKCPHVQDGFSIDQPTCDVVATLSVYVSAA